MSPKESGSHKPDMDAWQQELAKEIQQKIGCTCEEAYIRGWAEMIRQVLDRAEAKVAECPILNGDPKNGR